MYGRDEKFLQFVEKSEGKEITWKTKHNWKDNAVFKWILKKYGVRLWTRFIYSSSFVVGSGEHGNEMRFIFMALKVLIVVFWFVMPCIVVGGLTLRTEPVHSSKVLVTTCKSQLRRPQSALY
jgi:hypothetical protein